MSKRNYSVSSGQRRNRSATTCLHGLARPGYVKHVQGGMKHVLAERLAAYHRRGFLIRDRAKALGMVKERPIELEEIDDYDGA